MKKVIIVGCGKAGLLHYNSYKRCGLENNVYFVDSKKSSDYISGKNIYKTVEECIRKNSLNSSDIIIDICTPCSEFDNVLKCSNDNKIKNVIVEKPFVITKNNKNMIKNLKIVMVENYLYSKVTKKLKSFVDKYKDDISMVYMNFSKNRENDSKSNRGMSSIPTINYEIEIPHLVYMTQYLLDANKLNVIATCSKDMELEEKRILNHGYGLIVSSYKNTNILLESNLTSKVLQKKIIISTFSGITVEANYALYDRSLNLVTPARIYTYKNGKVKNETELKDDDNFTEFIKNAYDFFDGKVENPDLVSINAFSKSFLAFKNNLILRKGD